MRRPPFPLPAALLLALAGCVAAPPPARFEPSPTRGLVLVSLDTLRADHLGCYGYGRDTSPGLDRLASRGTLFLRHVVQVPSTLPSHMSIFTGLFPGEHGVHAWDAVLSPRIPLVAEVLRRAGYRTAGHTEGGWMIGRFGFARGFDEWSDPPHEADTDVARTFGRGVEFLRSVAPGERFFLFLHTYSIHDPYRPPEAFRRLFWPGEAPAGAPEPTGENLERINAGALPLPPGAVDYYRALYDASIRYVDSELERLLAELDRLGLAGETTVVVTSDHGEEFREHGRLAHTQAYYESLHAPLLVLHPAQTRGARVETVTQSVDLAPTLYELAGVPGPPSSGRSLVPRLRDPAAASDERAYSEAEIFWGTSRSLVEARDGRLDQLVQFHPAADGKATWASRELRFDSFARRLELRAVTLVEPRRIEVLAGGRSVASFEVTPEWRDYAVELPGAEGEKRVVTLRTPGCVVPAEAGLGDDTRCLSFKIRGPELDRVELYDLARDPAGKNDLSGLEIERARELALGLANYWHEAVHPAGRQQLPAARLEELKALGYL